MMDVFSDIMGRWVYFRAVVMLLALAPFSTGLHAQEYQKNDRQRTEIPESLVPFFKFQAGDALKISTYPDSIGFPRGVFFIDSDGYVDFPLFGFFKVTDITPQKLERMLNEKYITYLPHPNLEVRPLIRISLLGGFRNPGLYFLDPRESIWTAIGRAGGTLREDGIQKIFWERNNNVISRNILPNYEAGTSLYAMGVKSGDQFQVTPKPKFSSWDIFKTDVMPTLSFVLSTVISASSVYMTYYMYQYQLNLKSASGGGGK